MASKRKPTLVMVHGAWHEPSCFDRIRKPLEGSGFVCRAPALPSTGELAPVKTVDDDIAIVRSVLVSCLDRAEDMVVVAHSAGVYVACAAMQGLVGKEAKSMNGNGGGRVLGICAIAAWIPSFTGKGAFEELPPLDTGDWVETDRTILPDDPVFRFYNDLSSQDAAYWSSRIKPLHILPSNLESYEAWREIPVAYMVTEKDNILSLGWQEGLIKAVEVEGDSTNVTRVDSGHSPFLSMPETVVGWVKGFVEKVIL